MTRPFAQRMRRANQRTEQYRNEPAYRIRMINYHRKKAGNELLPLDATLPPVGKRNWVDKVRDGKGRFS